MATPSQGSSSTYSNQKSNRPYNSSRGRGQNVVVVVVIEGIVDSAYYRTTKREQSWRRNNQHGDMKTGLFKDSFLEDPWKDLIYGKQKVGRQSVDQIAITVG